MLKNASRKWWILFVTTTATSLFLMDSTILPVSLPVIEKQLDLSNLQGMWVINAYLLSFTMFLLVGGRLAEIFGYRILYLVGMSLFGIGSVTAALSQSDALLILARSVMGLGSALTNPATLSLIIATFPVHQRARALGIDTGVASLFMMLGPVLGGAFTQYLSWRLIFWFNVPFVLFGLVMGVYLLQKGKKQNAPFPYISTTLMSLGVFLLIYGLMQSHSFGWASTTVLVCLILGPLLLAAFVWFSLKIPHPLIDLRLFQSRLFAATNVVRFLLYMVITVAVMWVVFFEKGLSYSPIEIGVLIVVSALPVAVMAPVGGWLGDRYGHRWPITIGHLLVLFCLIWVIKSAHSTNVFTFLPGLFAFGAGLPLVMSPTVALGLSSIPQNRLGTGAAVMTALRQLASVLGVAVMTTVYYSNYETPSGTQADGFIAVCWVALILASIGTATTLLLRGAPRHVSH
ncbi:MAG: MFS transporter [Verrucomicrobia bacterium]|nr:MFS transporter [Verrucomicrobiota bacterium]MBS0645124.1 MFS transporter [Verrucomicrobiota bacterium]